MVETVILSVLAAMGIVLIVWCISGALLLPAGGHGYSVLFADGSDVSRRQIRAYLYLLRSGLSRLPLMVVDCGLSEGDLRTLRTAAAESTELRVFTPLEWEEYRETEREARVFGA